MKKILGHIGFVWFALVFVSIFLLFYPLFLFFLSNPKHYEKGNYLRKIWAKLVFLFTFCPVKIYKDETFKPVQGIYVSNHTSYIDIVCLGLILPSKVSFMAKKELSKIPLFGIFFKSVDIAVDRSSITNSHKAFVEADERVKKGYSVVIFPEGTIGKQVPELKKFKNGAFKLAVENQVPIIPITFFNNFKILPDEKFEFYPNVLKMKIHPKEPTNHLKNEDIDDFNQKIYTIIEQELKTQKIIN